MSFSLSKCPHIESEHCSHVDLKLLGEAKSCNECEYTGLNLWICLYENCHFVGCSEQANDHSTEHFQFHQHSVHMNVSSQRVWCYFCERELYLNNRSKNAQENYFSSTLSSFSLPRVDSEDSLRAEVTGSGTGLVGLQNIANTCYMNSALQALSNLLPMTHYFINCGDLVDHIVDQSTPRLKVAGLAKSYQRLMQEVWTKSNIPRDILAPRGILYGIRTVHPMFRGYQQHDTQEFLRCFMDQLHEELKEHNFLKAHENDINENNHEDDDNDEKLSVRGCVTPCEISESEYETCESSLSERSSPNPTEVSKSDYYGLHNTQRAAQKIETMPQPQQLKTQEQQQQSSSRSIISDVFDGKLLSSVQCLTCDRISAREETFQDLSLPIPNRDFLNVLHQTHSLSVQSLNAVDVSNTRLNEGWISWMWNLFRSWLYGPSVTLYDCMASFFSADELKGDNMYSCEKCNKLRTGVKYSRVLNLPEVLCIHLKRFRHDLSYSSKIASYVYFPLEGFDMRPYLHKDCQSNVPIYNLSSVICHHGTVGGGHYICYARNSLNGRWYEFDDQYVTQVAPETVQNCQAYVLFYQKHNPQMELVREEARNLSKSDPSQNSDMQFYISREWLTRLATFSEPGPINNQDILCPHGGVLHSKMPLISQIAVPISQQVWDFLYRKFGGGPAISMLFECDICRREAESLARRQYYELAVFAKYNGLQGEHDNSAIYAIAMPWLRKWQQFSRGLAYKEPGPITNESIAAPLSLEPSIISSSSSSIRSVRVGSDYAQLNAPLWRFLYDIYGGGPEILIRDSITDQIEIVDQDDNGLDDNHMAEDVSDTESNIGHRRTPELEKVEATSTESNYISNHNYNNNSAKLLTHQPSVKDPKYNRMSLKKIKVPGLQNTALRKRARKSRNALKHANMFGASGTYNNKSPMSDENGQQVDKDICQSEEVSSTAIPHAETDAFVSPETKSKAFQSDNSRLNNENQLLRPKKGRQRKRDKVKSQKFIALHDTSEQNETDV